MLILVLAGTATALATGLGAVPVFLLGRRAEALRPALWGLAAGVMAVASVVGLLLPALDEGTTGEVAAGLAAGALFLIVSRAIVDRSELAHGTQRGVGVRASVLVFVVLLVHSLPEGFAIGTAYASDTEGLALFVILAIAIQNIPEGTSVAIPMEAAGASRSRQFWAAVATSAPQPVGRSGLRSRRAHPNRSAPFSPICWWRRSRRCCGSRSRSLPGRCSRSSSLNSYRDAVTGGRWFRAAAGFATGAGVMLAASAALSL